MRITPSPGLPSFVTSLLWPVVSQGFIRCSWAALGLRPWQHCLPKCAPATRIHRTSSESWSRTLCLSPLATRKQHGPQCMGTTHLTDGVPVPSRRCEFGHRKNKTSSMPAHKNPDPGRCAMTTQAGSASLLSCSSTKVADWKAMTLSKALKSCETSAS